MFDTETIKAWIEEYYPDYSTRNIKVYGEFLLMVVMLSIYSMLHAIVTSKMMSFVKARSKLLDYFKSSKDVRKYIYQI